MTELSILLTDDQLKDISNQIHNLLTTEINAIRQQTGLEHRYLNKKQTCQYLSVSNNTLNNWIKNGLPTITINESKRFDKVAIDTWLNQLANSP